MQDDAVRPVEKGRFPTSSPTAQNITRDLYLVIESADVSNMNQVKDSQKIHRCAYIRACYLAEELRCFGYRTDCVLYQKSNGEYFNESRFHEAMDKLIDKTKAKYENLPE